MKLFKLLIVFTFTSAQIFAQSNYVHQIVVLNEGRYDYSQNIQVVPVTIGTINPSTFIYTPFDTIVNARFASDVVVDDQYIYAAADSFLIQYDKMTLQKTATIAVPGIRKIGLWNNQIVISKGEYLKNFTHYIEVYDANNMNLIYALDTIQGPKYSSEGIIINNNMAYVVVGNGFEWGNEKDIIGKIDLSTQTYLSEINLGSNATNPENIMLLNNKIYTLNNQDYSTASISEYDIVSGTVNTTDLLTPTGCGASALASNFVYYQIEGETKVQRFNTNSLSTFDTLQVNKSIYGMAYDNLNQLLYVGNTNYTTYGKIYKMNLQGAILDSTDVSISPGNMALDIRLGSGISDSRDVTLLSSYPNPSTDYVTLSFSEILSDKFSVKVLDSSGRLVNLNYQLEKDKLTFDVKQLKPSAYFIFIEDGLKKYKSQFIKL